MKILFWLYRSHTNSKGLAPIMMRITINNQRINFPTQLSIEEKSWDKDKQKVKGNDILTKQFNQLLLSLKSKAWDCYNDSLKRHKHITATGVKQYILGEGTTQRTLIQALDYQINHLKARVGNDIAPSTVKKYETAKRKVQEYLQAVKQLEDLPLDEVTHQFIHELDLFMRVEQGLHNNGVAKNMQQLRRVMKVAILNEWINKDPFDRYQCKIIEPKRVHLTKEELQRLEDLRLSCDRLAKVRDVFVFSCYTGLAYADVSKLAKEHIHQINGQMWIVLDRTKTKNQSVIPILPKAQGILQEYSTQSSGRLLPVISSQNLNKYLKEIAGMASINKRLSFHAARHTFATTVTLNNGVDITTVSAMLGHKMLKTTQIYARVNMNKIAKDVEQLYNGGQ